MVKPRSQQVASKKATASANDIDALADRLADKPYNEAISNQTETIKQNDEAEEMERITISITQKMRYMLEDIAIERKRAKEPSRSISAIARDALEDYFKKLGKI